jgi:hypothetical protein
LPEAKGEVLGWPAGSKTRSKPVIAEAPMGLTAILPVMSVVPVVVMPVLARIA